MKAYITFRDPIDDKFHVQINNHKISLSDDPDKSEYYCLEHESFECWEYLSDEELDAINNAEEVK